MTVHTIADESSLLKHQKMLNMIVIQYMSVSNITVIEKYICTLIHSIHISYLLKNVTLGFLNMLYI